MPSLRALALAATCFASLVRGINMTFYAPQCGVDYAFGPFYEKLLATNEDPSTTTELIDFFAPNGTQIVLQNAAVGGAEIIALKQAILPVDGSVRWNHFPNITFVADETPANKTYQLSGILHVITGANCSTTYFSTRFTVTKDEETGIPNLKTRSGSLLVYHGFIVESSEDPCFATY
ncbi:hypothetical protein IFR05_003352 [Cadophora sp. M221]|nr:hypothetical protein IFR05_003352 [Cadophora sp. M221]